jgi:thioredoxin reductase
MRSLKRSGYLILGAGPAGLQAGYFLEKKGRDYLILEAGEAPGTFFQVFPRHRKLISINKVYTGEADVESNLRYDWNSLLCEPGEEILFKEYSQQYFPEPASLLQYLADYAQCFGLRIRTETTAVRVSRDSGGFKVEDQRGDTYTCRRLIVATGLTRPYLPPIPGIETVENYFDFDTDPQRFKNQRVLIIGKGNSGFETAESLNEKTAVIHLCSPHPVTMAWKSHFVGHLRAVNANFIDTYQLKTKNAVIDAEIERITRQEDGYLVDIVFSHAKGQRRHIFYDHVIACTGFRFDTSIFDESCRPELAFNERFPAQTAEWESVNVPGLYFAGTVTQMRDYKRTMSGFIHGFRYNVAVLCRLLGVKYHGESWPHETLPLSSDRVVEALVHRISTSSSLFLQPGFFCDLLVVEDGSERVLYYRDLPKDYIRASEFGQSDHYYTVSLEYGHFEGDPLSMERDPNPDQAHLAAYLHPIIRKYEGPQLVAEHHVHDDLENEWHHEHFVALIRAFFRQQLGRRAPLVAEESRSAPAEKMSPEGAPA